MPNIRSAEKALRQSTRRHAHNLARKGALKKALKEFRVAAKDNDSSASEKLSRLYTLADKAAKTNTIKQNKASRIKSRAASLLKKSSS